MCWMSLRFAANGSSPGATLKLILARDGRRIEAMRFGSLDQLPPQARVAYRLGINEFNGLKTVQLNVEHFE